MPFDLPILVQAKVWLGTTLGLTADALHIYIGVLCLIATLASRRFQNLSWWMLLPGLLVALAGEVSDLYYDAILVGKLRWWESAHDLFNTNFLPLVLLFLIRFAATPSGADEDLALRK